jgi:mannose-6-phosphate isomerase-like protein (cupin superfamily)
MQIARARGAATAYEYGCDLRRLYPWSGVADPLWGSAIASVRPGEATSPHSHDEEETFIILAGQGSITIDGESENVETGDVIYLPRNSHHAIANGSASERLDFLTIYWGSAEARARMIDEVGRLQRDSGAARVASQVKEQAS